MIVVEEIILIVIWLFAFHFGLNMFIMMHYGYLFTKFCQSIEIYHLKATLKNSVNIAFDINAISMKMNCFSKQTLTNVDVLSVHSLF